MWLGCIFAFAIYRSDDTKTMSDNLQRQVDHIESELQVHATQCEERWKTIFSRIEDVEETLARMENRIITASGVIIMFLLGLIAAQIM